MNCKRVLNNKNMCHGLPFKVKLLTNIPSEKQNWVRDRGNIYYTLFNGGFFHSFLY